MFDLSAQAFKCLGFTCYVVLKLNYSKLVLLALFKNEITNF